MAWLSAYLPAVDAQTVMTAVQAVADKAGKGDDRTADQRRADALTTICAAVLTGQPIDGLPTWQGRKPSVQVTVALSTLLGVDEQPADLDGYGPIPADVARRIAADPTGTWHRLITDPQGQLIDYGRSVYRPPADLREYVIARDRTSRLPHDNRTARRSELDHVIPWAEGGTTCADNLIAESSRAHHLKHDAGWTTERHPDGTVTWTTPTGRSYDKPLDPYPVDQTRPKLDDDEPPPF